MMTYFNFGSATFAWVTFDRPRLLASDNFWQSKTPQLKIIQQNTSECRKTVSGMKNVGLVVSEEQVKMLKDPQFWMSSVKSVKCLKPISNTEISETLISVTLTLCWPNFKFLNYLCTELQNILNSWPVLELLYNRDGPLHLLLRNLSLASKRRSIAWVYFQSRTWKSWQHLDGSSICLSLTMKFKISTYVPL